MVQTFLPDFKIMAASGDDMVDVLHLMGDQIVVRPFAEGDQSVFITAGDKQKS